MVVHWIMEKWIFVVKNENALRFFTVVVKRKRNCRGQAKPK